MRRSANGEADSPSYHLRLFVAGDEPNSAMAKASLEKVCSEHRERDCRIEVIDVLQDSRLAVEENVLVTPALVVRGPERRTVILGNLADAEKVLAVLHVETRNV
ncbi:MAG: circadian clock KaiB family protein [Solirubrobacterales bacterium]